MCGLGLFARVVQPGVGIVQEVERAFQVGGALANLFWLRPENEPVVIELDGFGMYGIFWFEAAILGYEYWWMGFDPDTGVDLPRLATLMAKVGITQVA